MSGAYGNVQRGGLKLKPKAAAALSRAVAAAPAGAGTGAGAGAPLVSGAKRRIGEVDAGAAAAASHDAPAPADDAPAAAAAAAAAASSSSSSSAAAAAAAAPPPVVDRRTPAQRAHDEAQARRRGELAAKAATKTHRQRVDELNHALATAPEHFDLPRISYAGMG
jgi:hypothetical protein